MSATVICSGGMDSVTLAHMLHAKDEDLLLVSFNYGQKHSKELEFAKQAAKDLGVGHTLVDLHDLGNALGSALTSDDVEVPDGHYAEETMKITVVPNRNMIMLAIAGGIAVGRGDDYVATGVHGGDHFIYPDCRPEFIQLTSRALNSGNQGFCKPEFHIEAPFLGIGKHDIASIGSNLAIPVDYSKTWSCYKGGEKHCGTCGTCTERKEAFTLAGVKDPTDYEA